MKDFRGHLDAMLRGDVPQPPVAELLGLRLVSVAEGEVVFELDVRPEHANPMGTVQGGVICALADAAMGLAYASRFDGLTSCDVVDAEGRKVAHATSTCMTLREPR